jgi:hypothetical protein
VEDWTTPEAMKKRFPNFTAVYLPDGNYEKFYPALTPVNLFRLILNQYFGTKLDVLEDKIFMDQALPESEGIITWKEVTGMVRGSDSVRNPV